MSEANLEGRVHQLEELNAMSVLTTLPAVAPAEPQEPLSPFDLPPDRFRADLERRGRNRDAIIKWVREALVEGIDYGRIHVVKKADCGLGKDCKNPAHFSKPSLFKPGAEKICGKLEMQVMFPSLQKYEDAALSGIALENIILRCELRYAGRVLGEGVGARVISKDSGDINKSLKMAEKSAHIDATLRLAGLSEVFTQDLEDMNMAKDEDLTPILEASIAQVKERKALEMAKLRGQGLSGEGQGPDARDLMKAREMVAAEAVTGGHTASQPPAPSLQEPESLFDTASGIYTNKGPISEGVREMLEKAKANREAAAKELEKTCPKCGAQVQIYTAKAGHKFEQCSAARKDAGVYDEGGHFYRKMKA